MMEDNRRWKTMEMIKMMEMVKMMEMMEMKEGNRG